MLWYCNFLDIICEQKRKMVLVDTLLRKAPVLQKVLFFRFLHVCLCQNCLKYLEDYRASLRFFNFSPMWQQRHIIYTGKPWQLLQYIWQLLSPRAIYLMTYIKEQGKDDPCGEEREPLNGQPWAELGEREKADHCRQRPAETLQTESRQGTAECSSVEEVQTEQVVTCSV